MAKSQIIPIYKIGDIVTTNQDVVPESPNWEKGYWKIPKGSKVRIIDIETSDSKQAELDEIYLIRFSEAEFWVEQSVLSQNTQTDTPF